MRLPFALLLAAVAAPAMAAGLDRPLPTLTVAALDEGGGAVIAAAPIDRRMALAAYHPRQTAYGLTVVVPDAAFAAAALRAPAPLAGLAAYVLADPAIRLRVAAHADAPTAAAVARARGRAAAVAAALGATGIAADRIETLDEGADHPIAEGLGAAARAQNRRVEITLLGEQDGPLVASR